MTSFTDAGMMFLADLAGDVNMKAASLADAGRAFPADIAEEATVGVTSLADAGMVSVGVTDLSDAGMVTVGVTDLADVTPVNLIGVPECGSDRLSPGVWCRERTLIRKNSDGRFVGLI